jgi:hypothetical protein
MYACTSWNIGPYKIQICRIYNTRLRLRNIEEDEHAHYDANFERELDSMKLNMARITNLLEKTLKNIFGEGPSNRSVIFAHA